MARDVWQRCGRYAGAVAFALALTGTASAKKVGPTAKPGLQVKVGEAVCTLGFLYKHGGREYAVTAGHCVYFNDPAIEQKFAEGTGPVVRLTRAYAPPAVAAPVDGPRIGEVIYVAKNQPADFTLGLAFAPDIPPWADLAIIRLDPRVVIDPAVCFFGGPTGTNEVPAPAPLTLKLYGHGGGVARDPLTGQTLLPARSGAGVIQDEYALRPEGLVSAPGDSGGPVLDGQGRAAATLTGIDYSPRIAPGLARGERILGFDLDLLTAPLVGSAVSGQDPACTS